VRVLAIDPGTVRLGLALSDPSGTIAQPLSVLTRRTNSEDLKQLADVVTQYQVEMIVVGLPRTMGGRLEAAARGLASRLARRRGGL